MDGQIVMNPNQAQQHASKLDLTVAATGAKVVMIEAGADQLPDEIMYEAIVKAHEEIKAQVDFINAIVAEIGKEKMTYDHADFDQELFDKIVADHHGRSQGRHGHRRQKCPGGALERPDRPLARALPGGVSRDGSVPGRNHL